MCPSQKILTRVRLGQFFVARVGSGQPFLVWVWKISPNNIKFSNFFHSGKKNCFESGQEVPWSKAGHPLIHCGAKSMLGLKVGSGTISTMYHI